MKTQRLKVGDNVTVPMFLKELREFEERLKKRLELNAQSIKNDVEIKMMRRESRNADLDIRLFKLEMRLDKLESLLEKLDTRLDRFMKEPLDLIERSYRHQAGLEKQFDNPKRHSSVLEST
ncbi:MAG: hypothetical protein HY707_02820 [Ignavibacteriae bacterium]|nr:hypothetical protein [Ignavibacteriota bacterium]